MVNNVKGDPGWRKSAARRVYIADLTLGSKQGPHEGKFEDLGEVKIFGTILGKNIYRTEGKVEYGILLVGDGSGSTIRIKAWGSGTSALDQLEKGELVDIVGKVRHSRDETFLVPEIVRKLPDPNWRIVRELEIIEDYLSRKKAKIRGSLRPDGKEVDLRREIISTIDIKGGDAGIDFTELVKCIRHSNEEEIKKTLNELLDQGMIYETRPGRYRK
jgi:RPA family protein